MSTTAAGSTSSSSSAGAVERRVDSARDEPGALHRGARAGRGRQRGPAALRRRGLRARLRHARGRRPARSSSACAGATPTGTRSRRPRPRSARRRSSSSIRVDVDLPQLVVPDVRAAMPAAAALFFGDPTARARRRRDHRHEREDDHRVPARAILEADGRQTGLLTNIERRVGGESARPGSTRPRRSTCSGCSARWPTPATAPA